MLPQVYSNVPLLNEIQPNKVLQLEHWIFVKNDQTDKPIVGANGNSTQKKELCIFYIILLVLLFFLVNISEVIIEYDVSFSEGIMANLRESQY